MRTKTKFKIGDKVRLLPSIVTRCVLASEIGKIGTIIQITSYGSLIVRTDKYSGWGLQECDVVPFFEKGQQLLLWSDIFD